MMWARRLLVGTGFAVAGLAMASGAAGAATCVTPQTLSEPGCVEPPAISGSSTSPSTAAALPYTAGTSTSTSGSASGTVSGSSSLPFTGADIEELAVVGAGAVLAGGLLLRRRRSAI